MALDPIPDREIPRFTHVADYTVQRLGRFPQVRVTLEETVYLTDLVTEAVTGDIILAPRTLAISDPAWVAQGTALLSRLVCDGGLAPLGTIVEVTVVEDSLLVTLDQDLTGVPTQIHLVAETPTSPHAYRRARAGKSWTIVLDSGIPEQATLLRHLMGTVYLAAAQELLAELGITTVTTPELLTALSALAARGRNIDTFLTEQGEHLELVRRAGTLTAGVFGDVPA